MLTYIPSPTTSLLLLSSQKTTSTHTQPLLRCDNTHIKMTLIFCIMEKLIKANGCIQGEKQTLPEVKNRLSGLLRRYSSEQRTGTKRKFYFVFIYFKNVTHSPSYESLSFSVFKSLFSYTVNNHVTNVRRQLPRILNMHLLDCWSWHRLNPNLKFVELWL